MKAALGAFIDSLARAEVAPDAFNQYAYDSPDNAIRRQNLLFYLGEMAARSPRLLLVGEAPGYKGCRLTGVPFSNEYLLVNGIEQVAMFGLERGYQKTSETAKAGKEQTATIIWETLLKLDYVPLAWNAFPFHPHKIDNQWSNRTPRREELRQGAEFLARYMALFEIEAVVAVGNKAHATLTNMDIACQKVRHPAQGGKNDFVAGLSAIINAYIV